MDFRSAVLSPSGGPTLQPSLFPAPPAPLTATALGSVSSPLFLYPGQVSPVKPPNFHLMPTSKAESHGPIGVPPLGMQPLHSALLPPSQGALPITSSPESASSFAAALKSLARSVSAQDLRSDTLGVKTGDNGAVAFSPKRARTTRPASSEPTSAMTASSTSSAPSTVPVTSNGTRPHPASPLSCSISDTRKVPPDGSVSASGVALTNSLSTSGDKSGFQPYRPDSAVYSGLYPLQSPHHSLYSARLEEQLYLERLALLRSPSALALGCSPFSAFTSGQFPPSADLHSLSPALYLHSQSLYLQERLKLEEEARRRSTATPATERDHPRPATSTTISATPVVSSAPADRVSTPSRASRSSDTGNGSSTADDSPSLPIRAQTENNSFQITRPSSVYRPYLLSPAREQNVRAPLDLSPAAGRKPVPSPHSPQNDTPTRQAEPSTALNLSSGQNCQAAVDLTSRQPAATAGGKRERSRPGRNSPALPSPANRSTTIHSPAELRDRSPVSTVIQTSLKPDFYSKKEDRVAPQQLAATSPAVASLPPSEQQLKTPPAQLTASLNRASDLPAKRVFLSSLGLVPDSNSPPPERGTKRPTPYSRPLCPPDEPAVTMTTAGSWRGVSEATSVYTQYNSERAAASNRARAQCTSLQQRHSELQRSGQQLQLRMNAAVASRQQLHVQRDQLQLGLTQLRQLVRRLQSG